MTPHSRARLMSDEMSVGPGRAVPTTSVLPSARSGRPRLAHRYKRSRAEFVTGTLSGAKLRNTKQGKPDQSTMCESWRTAMSSPTCADAQRLLRRPSQGAGAGGGVDGLGGAGSSCRPGMWLRIRVNSGGLA